MRKNKKAFTLIELIAVLVMLAIIALIVTPLVMNIVKKAKDSANKRSVDAYGKAVELAVTSYLLDNGDYPTDISSLTIEYSGNEVVCTTQKLNEDGSIYLSGCTVGGRSVDGYTYGDEEATPTYEAYEIGDEVSYNNVDYYVIEDSSANEANVTLLKKTPLTVAEVNQYGGVGTANNHVNMHATTSTESEYYQKAYNNNGYGGMQYYSSDTCNVYETSEGCTTDYEQSEVKYVVDAWKAAKAPAATEARLITYEELLNNLGYENNFTCTGGCFYSGSLENVPNWVYNSNYWYWTMSPNNDSASHVWYVSRSGTVGTYHVDGVGDSGSVVRPVITLSKTAI